MTSLHALVVGAALERGFFVFSDMHTDPEDSQTGPEREIPGDRSHVCSIIRNFH
jgi:hypothetical protein